MSRHIANNIDSGLAAVPVVREHDPALLRLDLMLPGRGGIDSCPELRGFTQLPVIMMTALVEQLDHLHDGDACAAADRAVDSHVRKLEQASGGEAPIRSVYGVGHGWE